MTEALSLGSTVYYSDTKASVFREGWLVRD